MTYDPSTHSYDGKPAWDILSNDAFWPRRNPMIIDMGANQSEFPEPRYVGRLAGYVGMAIKRSVAYALPVQRIIDCQRCGHVTEIPAGVGGYVCRCGEPFTFDVDALLEDIREVLREMRDEQTD